jgi:small-conductance mechanosensitive channel
LLLKEDPMLELDREIAGVSVVTWATGLLTVVLIAIAHWALHAWSQRRARQQEAPSATGDAGARHWIALGLRGSIPPLALLLWIQGLHFALSTLLSDVNISRIVTQGTTILGVARGLGTMLALAWLLARIGRALEALFHSLSSKTSNDWDDVMAPLAGRAVRLLLPLLAIILGAPALAVAPHLTQLIQNGVSLLLIGTIAVLLLQVIDAVAKLVLRRHEINVADNRTARAIHTQVTVLRKIATVVVCVFAVACMLMVFESVRQFGTAILASAGVAGIIVGFAAQKSIATLLAGFQIALTQPIRIDDVVIVEGEWGRIEEITLTYVVVRIWDLRRLVLPITYFIETPFQNWTRQSADILGTVFLHVDYNVPLDALREELKRILEASPHWDRKVCVLQVTDAQERSLQIRALASAPNASAAWDLRCEVREKLIGYLQRNYPDSLPRVRAAVTEARLPAARYG